MTCRLNFTKRVGMRDGRREAYQADASMTQPHGQVKRQSDENLSRARDLAGKARPARASRFGPAALSLASCGRVVPLRVNVRYAWGRGHAPREVAWLLNPPAFEGRRLWWQPGQVVRVVRRG